jgi:FkbM family methyltransferase
MGTFDVKAWMKRKLRDGLGITVCRSEYIQLELEPSTLRRFFAAYSVDCVFDIGANAGQYAEMLRKRVGYAGEIVSFEPIPALAADLRVKAQNESRWTIEEFAISGTEGSAVFHVARGDQFSSLNAAKTDEFDLSRDGAEVVNEITVKLMKLETAILRHKSRLGFKNLFLKLDTQGHDFEILRNATAIIPEIVGIQTELAIKRLYENSAPYNEVITFLASNEFALTAFVPNNIGHFPFLIETDGIFINTRLIDSKGRPSAR